MNDVRQPEREHELRLVPSPAEVSRARQFARYVLQERQIAPGRIATAELLVSELVTNAVKMWCELDIARGVSASDMTVLLSSLPRRSRSSTRSARRLEAMTDPVLLRRVRDGLLALGSEEGPAK